MGGELKPLGGPIVHGVLTIGGPEGDCRKLPGGVVKHAAGGVKLVGGDEKLAVAVRGLACGLEKGWFTANIERWLLAWDEEWMLDIEAMYAGDGVTVGFLLCT